MVAADPERDKIRNAVIIAAFVLVVAIGGAFLLLSGRDDSGASSDPGAQTLEQAKTADAQTTEMARTAQTAMETFATDNNGSYAGATLEDLRGIEATLANVGSLQISSDKTGYSVSVSSSTGDVFTIQRSQDGMLAYTCSMPGVGTCPASGNWN